MEDSNGAFERLVNTISITETRDNQIIQVLMKVVDQSKGIQNKVFRLLEAHLEYYGKRDIQALFQKCKQEMVDTNDEIKPYILIAQRILELYHIITLKMKDFMLGKIYKSGIMMLHENYAYHRDFSEVKKVISNLCVQYNVDQTNTTTNVFHYIANQTQFDPDNLNYNGNIIVFKNGVFDFKTMKLYKPKEPWKLYFFYEIPHHLDIRKRYECPKFKKALVKWLDKKGKKGYRIGKRNILINDIFEGIGLCLTMNMGFRTSFLNYGPPRCGKTQFFNIICYIIGKRNISNTSLQRLSKNEFGAEGLEFKILNYNGDLPQVKILDTGLFKNITGGDSMIESEKKGGEKYNIRPVCKMWFNANKVPMLGNWDDIATYDRITMIPFANQFEMLDGDTIDNFYEHIINDPIEIQGIIHEAIRGFKRLSKRGGFREILKADTVHTWKYFSNRFYAFVYDNCIYKPMNRINREEFWDFYWEVVGPQDPKNTITINLGKLGITAREGRIKGSGNKAWFYMGIDWKDDIRPIVKKNNKEKNIDEILENKPLSPTQQKMLNGLDKILKK